MDASNANLWILFKFLVLIKLLCLKEPVRPEDSMHTQIAPVVDQRLVKQEPSAKGKVYAYTICIPNPYNEINLSNLE